MNLITFFEHLDEVDELTFVLRNGTHVPPHFHLTEVSKYVGCGGTQRDEQVISLKCKSTSSGIVPSRKPECKSRVTEKNGQSHR